MARSYDLRSGRLSALSSSSLEPVHQEQNDVGGARETRTGPPNAPHVAFSAFVPKRCSQWQMERAASTNADERASPIFRVELQARLVASEL